MKTTLLTLSLSFLFLNFSIAQEICDDGIDNDSDGLIDQYDPDCANFSSTKNTFLGNENECAENTDPYSNVFSLQLAYQSMDSATNSATSLTLGDLDRDGIPEIVSFERAGGMLYLLNGDDASIKHSTSVIAPDFSATAIANLNDDNCGELFLIQNGTGSAYISAFDCELNSLWQSEQLAETPGTLSLADFDRDGKAEMYYKDEIRDPITGDIIVKSNTADWRTLGSGVIAANVLGDEDLELIVGNKIYEVDLGTRTSLSGSLNLIATMPSSYQVKYNGRSGSNSLADYNLDGHMDIILTGGDEENITTVFLWDIHNNEVKKFQDPRDQIYNYRLGWRNGTGRVVLGDIDGDGKMNAVFVSGRFLYALDENWNALWVDQFDDPAPAIINEESSGVTSPTIFDLVGNGIPEIIYRDEDYLYIINGSDGSINTAVHCRSRTIIENALIADVDADGAAEICIPCYTEEIRPTSTGAQIGLYEKAEVRVYKSGNKPWVAARKVWNQHAYFNVNVNDDLTIPRQQQKHHLSLSGNKNSEVPARPLNGFMNQSPYLNSNGYPVYQSVDLQFAVGSFKSSPASCLDDSVTVSFDIKNSGNIDHQGDFLISFYDGDPLQNASELIQTDTLTLDKIAFGESFSINDHPVKALEGSYRLYAVLNDNGSPTRFSDPEVLECNYNNNRGSIAIDILPFTLSTRHEDKTFCSQSVQDLGSAQAFHIEGGTELIDPYEFYWFNGRNVKDTADFIGPVYQDLEEGIYTVYAIDLSSGCSSDTVQLNIGLIDNSLSAEITVVSPQTECINPDGALSVSINGGEPVGIFSFEWYEGNTVGGGLAISTSHMVNGLQTGFYTVLITDKSTGCQTSISEFIPDETISPDLSTANAGSDIASCDNTISLSANSGSSNENGSWSIISSPNGIAQEAIFTDVNDPSTDLIIKDQSISGDYEIRWTISTNDRSCSESSDEVLISYETKPSAGILKSSAKLDYTNKDMQLDLSELLESADTGGIWSLTNTSGSNGNSPTLDVRQGILDLSFATTAAYEYTYTVSGSLECAVDTESILINYTYIKKDQQITFELSDTLYQEQLPYSLEASLSSGLSPQYVIDSGMASIVNNQLLFEGESIVKLKAFHPGNDTLNPVEAVQRVHIISNSTLTLELEDGDGNPVERGIAKLFHANGGLFAKENLSRGIVQFINVRDGDYIIQVVPTGNASANIFPTYYKEAFFHQEATVLQINEDITLEMTLNEKPSSIANFNGIGQVNGQILSADGSRPASMDTYSKAEGRAIVDLLIYLIAEEQNEIIRYDISDTNGTFSMENIPAGAYQLILEMPGTASEKASFHFEYDITDASVNMTIYIDSKGIVSVEFEAVLENKSKANSLSFYPNPTEGKLYIKEYSGEEQKLQVLSLQGSVLKEIILNSEKDPMLDLSNLANGIYFIRIPKEDGKMIKVIKR